MKKWCRQRSEVSFRALVGQPVACLLALAESELELEQRLTFILFPPPPPLLEQPEDPNSRRKLPRRSAWVPSIVREISISGGSGGRGGRVLRCAHETKSRETRCLFYRRRRRTL